MPIHTLNRQGIDLSDLAEPDTSEIQFLEQKYGTGAQPSTNARQARIGSRPRGIPQPQPQPISEPAPRADEAAEGNEGEEEDDGGDPAEDAAEVEKQRQNIINWIQKNQMLLPETLQFARIPPPETLRDMSLDDLKFVENQIYLSRSSISAGMFVGMHNALCKGIEYLGCENGMQLQNFSDVTYLEAEVTNVKESLNLYLKMMAVDHGPTHVNPILGYFTSLGALATSVHKANSNNKVAANHEKQRNEPVPSDLADEYL